MSVGGEREKSSDQSQTAERPQDVMRRFPGTSLRQGLNLSGNVKGSGECLYVLPRTQHPGLKRAWNWR